jgi:DNA helicase-2/ATP-dependent DNA helicase PcrA
MLAKTVAAATPEEAIEVLDGLLANRPEIQKVLPSIAQAAGKPAKAIELATEHLEPVLSGKYDDWERRRKDYTLLAELAGKHRSLSAFVETYTLDPVSASEAQQDDSDIVTLITVHSAKGTEAEACYVIGAQQGNYPHSRSQGDPAAEEEERRVLYVALTRAKDELFITRTLGRGYSSYRSFASPGNYFLESIPMQLVATQPVTPSFRHFSFGDDVI